MVIKHVRGNVGSSKEILTIYSQKWVLGGVYMLDEIKSWQNLPSGPWQWIKWEEPQSKRIASADMKGRNAFRDVCVLSANTWSRQRSEVQAGIQPEGKVAPDGWLLRSSKHETVGERRMRCISRWPVAETRWITGPGCCKNTGKSGSRGIVWFSLHF